NMKHFYNYVYTHVSYYTNVISSPGKFYYYALNNFALIATIIVLRLIKTAPTAGLRIIPIGAKTPAANGIAKILYPEAHHKFCTILRYVFLDKSIRSTTSLGSLLTSTTSAV